jgi:hypothetical protein
LNIQRAFWPEFSGDEPNEAKPFVESRCAEEHNVNAPYGSDGTTLGGGRKVLFAKRNSVVGCAEALGYCFV